MGAFLDLLDGVLDATMMLLALAILTALIAVVVLYVIDVTNNGDADSGPFTVGVFSDLSFPPSPGATPDEIESVDSLGPGETAALSVAIRSTPSAYWSSYVLVDPDDSISEPNESNNLGAFPVYP